MKHGHKYLTSLLVITLLTAHLLMPSPAAAVSVSAAASSAAAASAKGVSLTYTAAIRQSGQGSLYWNYNQSGSFFYQGGGDYNKDCLAAGTSCRFTALTPRSLIVEPGEGWYFDGFYTSSGQKLTLESQRIDVVRVTVNGVYYYDSVVSYSDPSFRGVTKAKYTETIKAAIKALYGTARYKIMETLDTYKVPKKSQTIQARFKEKKAPALSVPEQLKKSIGDSPFCAVKGISAAYQPTFRSSSSKLLAVDRGTGLCTIKGEGIAVVSLAVPASKETLRGEWKIKVYIYPKAVQLTSASRSKDKKSMTVKWRPDTLCSGYEIQAAADKSFSKITAKKTVTSGKTSSASVKTAKDAACKYLRIRPYKKSRGETLYGPWTEILVK